MGLPTSGPHAITGCRLTRNRTVMVSFRRGELRVHEGYLDAPEPVLAAIVVFVSPGPRAARRRAQEIILAHPIVRAAAPVRRPERMRPEDAGLARALAEWHARYNAEHFGGALRTIPVHVSRRLKSRLGHYVAAAPGVAPEIAIGRLHLRRHGWDEALHTLLHEMVHQWQDESGLPVDHGAGFRRKAREVGVTAAARRAVESRAGGVVGMLRPAPPNAPSSAPAGTGSDARSGAAAPFARQAANG
jgi:hypothetical protein